MSWLVDVAAEAVAAEADGALSEVFADGPLPPGEAVEQPATRPMSPAIPADRIRRRRMSAILRVVRSIDRCS
jgi:hypothetical protein